MARNSTAIVYDMAEMIIKVVVVMFLVMVFIVRPVNVDGHSMEDTLHDGDRLAVWSLGYTPQPKDIVIISHGAMLQEPLVKRVIATGGQRIRINYATGEVSVDGKILDEDYVKGKTIEARNPLPKSDFVIPEDYVFVMGDNREHSTDSRSVKVGLVPVNNIIGKAVCTIYPFNDFKIL